MSRPFMNQRSSARTAVAKRRALWGALAALAAGCVLDPDDRCGPNEVAWEGDERCVCAEGAAYTAEGCVLCGVNEVVTAGGCACAVGHVRGGDGVCAEVEGAIGSPCSTDAECANPSYPHCQESPGGSYCTSQNCEAGCDSDFSCNLAATPTYCQRAPTGVGTPCTTSADCSSFDANYCEAVVSRSCLVRNCNLAPDSCFTGFECCDFTVMFPNPEFSSLCLAEGLCQN